MNWPAMVKANNRLSELLEQSLPEARLALLKWVAGRAAAQGDALYVVGGFVRDLLLGAPSLDFDFVVAGGDAISLARQLAEEFGGQVHAHRRFGTAKWSLDPSNGELIAALGGKTAGLPARLDFVTARSEDYERPTALPSVRAGDIEGDLLRRDFSINAMALRLDQPHYAELLDVVDGEGDLRRKSLRVLHERSFEDDPTRALRAVRLEMRLGFEIEQRTLALLEQALPLLAHVSGERIRSELELIFGEPSCLQIMSRLEQLGLLQAIHPELTWDEWLAARFRSALDWTAPEDWQLQAAIPVERLLFGLWAYRLPGKTAEELSRRLRLSKADQAAMVLRAGGQGVDLDRSLPPSGWVHRLHPLPEAALIVSWLALDAGAAGRSVIERYLAEWRWVHASTDGSSLRQLGLPPGPAYRQILGKLRDARLDGEVTDVDGEQELLAELVEQARRDG